MFTDPLKNLKILDIRETDVVADLGAGSGFYTILAAKIATRGKVYAIELSKDFLKTVLNKAKEEKLGNVECLWGDVEKVGGTKLGDAVLDKAIASNVFLQVHEKENFVREIKRILKPKGKALVIDWSDESAIAPKSSLVSKDHLKDMFIKNGFTLERDIDAGAHHYGMIFSKL